MCGITGFFSPGSLQQKSELEKKLSKMTISLRHRGPDDTDEWLDYDNKVALGHRRLSILDLSQKGKQPFKSKSGKYIISFNGEIYNFKKIKKEISSINNIKWKTNTDTEVICEAFETWGIKNSLKKFDGMFAIVVWDCQNKKICLIRDRFGIKPLYYGIFGNTLLFGSELKSLKSYGINFKISKKGLNDFLQLSYIPAPHTIYENIYKLMPGKILSFDQNLSSVEEIYWDMNEVAENSLKNQYNLTYEEIVKKTENILLSSTESHLISDAPIGSFLSGGIDSSLITSLMSEASNDKINTFSIGFEGEQYNEAIYAKKIAKYLNTNHTEYTCTTKNMLDLVDQLPYTYDEPFADSSQMPTSLLCSLTGQKVKVSLSGDGGDEMFGGYNRYIYAEKLWKFINSQSAINLRFLNYLIKSISEKNINNLYKIIYTLGLTKINVNNPGQIIKKASNLLNSSSQDELYKNIITIFPNIENLVNHSMHNNFEKNLKNSNKKINFYEYMNLYDTKNYLTDDILCKVDRASMRHSLEVRVPFINKEIFSHAWKIPLKYKVRENQGKIILKDILNKRIPKELFVRPKSGFAIPIDDLIRNDLGKTVSEVLEKNKIEDQNIFNFNEIKKLISAHNSGINNGHKIWNLFIFQQWHDTWH